MAPRVSVLLPVRNGLPFLRASLQSVLAQSFADFELLVLNDRSTDGSEAAARMVNDPRVRVIGTEGRGLAHALNVGLAEAAGAYIARHDADDLSHPERLARQIAFLDTYTRVDVLATRVHFIDADGAPIVTPWTAAVAAQWDAALAPDAIANLLPLTCCLVHGTVMARRDVLVEAGGYREDLPVAQDYDLWLRLLPRQRFARLPERLYSFRLHPGQASRAEADRQRREAVRAKLRYVARRYGCLQGSRAWIADEGPGAAIYRELLPEAGWIEVGAHDAWDIAIFTDFSTLDARMSAVDARGWPSHTSRVGNFLLRGRRAA
ncbi:MAG: glycosyltransferase [Acidobacteriota bacterium]